MMSALSEQQALFWRVITWPTGVKDFVDQADDATRRAFADTFGGDDALDAVARMNIYAESYFWRLRDVLGEQYRVVAWLVGPTRFHNLVTDFVLHRPSRSPDVRRFGSALPEYLAQHGLEAELGGLAELARVERACVQAIDVPDQPRIERRHLQAVPVERWPGLRLRLAAHVRVLTTGRSYPRLWASCMADEPSPDPVPPLASEDRHDVLVWRNRTEVFHRGLALASAAALRAIGSGRRFEEVCEAARREQPDLDPGTVVAWLGQWIDDGLVVALEP